MVRIAGVDLPLSKRILISLTYIYGIGKSSSFKILSEVGIDPSLISKKLTEDQVKSLRNCIESNYIVEGKLRANIFRDIKRLKDINCYIGIRHKRSLSVHGQRTKTNCRTRKSKKRSDNSFSKSGASNFRKK